MWGWIQWNKGIKENNESGSGKLGRGGIVYNWGGNIGEINITKDLTTNTYGNLWWKFPELHILYSF